MRLPLALLKVLGKAVLNAVGGGVAGDVLIDVLPDAAQEVWEWWRKARTPEEQREDVEALAQAPAAEAREAVREVVAEIAGDRPKEIQIALSMFLSQVPDAVRQSLRRPADPSGRSVPAHLAPQGPDDVLALLPAHLPRFQPGDRPLPGIDWELVELLGAGGFGEVWKARNPHFDAVPPVALKFCLDPAAKDRLLRHEAAILNQVMRQGRHPGIVALRHTYLSADPPCLEYEYVAGGDLAGLIQEWRRRPGGPERVTQAARLTLDLARIVAFAHRLSPPIVHRDLKPANILVEQSADGRTILRIADFGIGGVAAGHALAPGRRDVSQGQFLATALRGAHTPLYASPQQARGGPPDPRDDVYSLGVIWYQMLTGNLTASRPGGARWAKRLADLGTTAGMIDLLGACVEEDPADRPADAAVLADRLASLTPDVPAPPSDDLAGQVQRTMQAVARTHDEARRLAAVQHDYAAAARLLETAPDHLRDADLYRRICENRDRVTELDRTIREAVHATRLNGLRPQVEELLRLQPEREDLRLLLAALPGAAPAEPDASRKDFWRSSAPAAPSLPRALENSLGMKLVLIPAGMFWMGSPDDEAQRGADEGPRHWVALTRPFYLGVHAVTQHEFEAVMGRNPSHFTKTNGGGPSHPVEQVTWHDAVEFCKRLSAVEEEKRAGRMYRLPTEAEWEYACRADAATPFAFGAALSSERANFDGNHPYGAAEHGPHLQRTSKAGAYRTNAWGLYDMHGNVWEWCADWYAAGYYADSPEHDPPGPPRETQRVLRGGSWNNSGHLCRAARRNKYAPDFRNDAIGFRAAMTVAS